MCRRRDPSFWHHVSHTHASPHTRREGALPTVVVLQEEIEDDHLHEMVGTVEDLDEEAVPDTLKPMTWDASLRTSP